MSHPGDGDLGGAPCENQSVETTSASGGSPQPTETGPSGAPQRGRSTKRSLGLTAAGIFVVATFAMWLWMLFIYDPGLLVDELADRTFPTRAEEICAVANDEISHLPPAESTDDPIERAEVIDTANSTLARMVADLAPLAPTEPPQAAEAVGEWLDDWGTHLEDRQRYAEDLRVDPTARFTETPKGSKQISRAIDSFAEVNRMPSCGTPGDV